MNSSQPLSRSIVMDYVSKHNRGKWNAIEALAWGLFWNMSAVVGGYLIDDYSFQTAFFITASVYTVGTLPLFYISRLVVNELPAEAIDSSESPKTELLDVLSEVNEEIDVVKPVEPTA